MDRVVLLALLSLFAHTAHSELPWLKEINCEEQHWPNLQDSSQWGKNEESGKPFIHQGITPEQKKDKVKVADFDVNLTGYEGDNAAVMCYFDSDVDIVGFWCSRSGAEATDCYVFATANDVKNSIRFGMKAAPGDKNPNSRIEIYSAVKPNRAKVTCAAGSKGKDCPRPGLTLTSRDMND